MNGRLYTKEGQLWIDGLPLSPYQAKNAAKSVGLPHAVSLVKELEEDRDAFFELYRDWLIDLGWTPPKGQPEAIKTRNE